MIKYFIIIAFCLFVGVSTLCRPIFLAENGFLDDFVGGELLSLLAVILVITFASVANIHLALNQIIIKVYEKNIEHGQTKSRPVRDDINGNAWLLFWAFIATALVLLIKGMFSENIYIHSAMNGLALSALLVNVLVFRDIYQTVFAIASSDLAVKGAKPPDYSSDTPSVGQPKE